MITKFKIFEHVNIFNIGDKVYILKSAFSNQLVTPEIATIIDIKDGRYVTDIYPNISIHNRNLIYDYKYDGKKYNL